MLVCGDRFDNAYVLARDIQLGKYDLQSGNANEYLTNFEQAQQEKRRLEEAQARLDLIQQRKKDKNKAATRIYEPKYIFERSPSRQELQDKRLAHLRSTRKER
jgi:hypothetical protein